MTQKHYNRTGKRSIFKEICCPQEPKQGRQNKQQKLPSLNTTVKEPNCTASKEK
jgi:hypothetical protein